MRVLKVAPATFWVECPEADIRILCGCPPDAVKHLIRLGLIHSVEQKGVTFETGPNAILLTDLPLQKGVFANLSEFPILQMLYRQGMILPNHPNNNGKKPLLIGSRSQLKAQLAYIHRGNYGLVSEEELMATGLDQRTAQDWMRVKLHFAFGRIRPPEDLIDCTVLEDKPIELGNGLTVRRKSINVFEFSHGSQVFVVDLNLESAEIYRPSFKLNYQSMRREYFSVIHSGEGDGWDAERPTTGSLITYQGRVFLVDAGPSLQFVLDALGVGVHEIEGIFHTHCHDDHFAGLTTLVQADHRVKYFATPAVRASVTKKLVALMDLQEADFNTYFDVHDLEWNKWQSIDGLEVKPVFSPHPVENSIFYFRTMWKDGWKTYAHCADLTSFKVLFRMVTTDPEKNGISPEGAEAVRRSYLEPANIKKLDIGGGLIHGEARDFIDDKSDKIILAHTAKLLSPEDRIIGSGAPFGTVDVLIPAEQDYTFRFAHSYLSEYLPDVPDHQLRLLLNNQVQLINPETILVRPGRLEETVYLVLSGTVESINAEANFVAHLTAGTMVGEMLAVDHKPISDTIRATSFVRVLCIPANLYRMVIEQNGLIDRVRKLALIRQYFNHSQLLGEHISTAVRNRIAAAAKEDYYDAGERVAVAGRDHLVMVRDGGIRKLLNEQPVGIVGPGSYIGATEVLTANEPFRYEAAEWLSAVTIPGEILRHIPVIRLKLEESHRRQVAELQGLNAQEKLTSLTELLSAKTQAA